MTEATTDSAYPLPSEIFVEEMGDTTIYRLPVWTPGALGRGFGSIYLLGALAWTGFFLFLDAEGLGIIHVAGFPAKELGATSIVFSLIFLIPGFLGICGSLTMVLPGTCTIALSASTLRATDHAGIIRRSTRQVKLHRLIGFDVSGRSISAGYRRRFAQPRTIDFAMSYPRKWRRAVAEDMANRLVARGVTEKKLQIIDMADMAAMAKRIEHGD